MTDNWIVIADSELDFSSTRDEHVLLYPSPYDVPKALRSEFDKNTLEIFFKYIGEDEKTTSELVDGVVIYNGKYSGRIYKIKINDVSRRREGNVSLLTSIKRAISYLTERSEEVSASPTLKWNYRSAKKVLDNHSSELLQTV